MRESTPLPAVLCCFMFAAILAALVCIMLSLSDTNRLLSEFHRIDTVKERDPIDPHKFGAVCDGKNNDTAALNTTLWVASKLTWPMMLPPNCTVSSLIVPDFQAETTSDPNICYHWSSDCEDPDDCQSICHMHREP